MVELAAAGVSVVGCFAAPVALDSLGGIAGTMACRVAPDEAMILGARGSAAEIVRVATSRARAEDPDAVVLDVTDGWAVWTIAGDGAREAFARLSAVVLPPEGFTQGNVANLPVKVVALPDRLHLLVPAMWGAHLRGRILGLGLDVRETAAGGDAR